MTTKTYARSGAARLLATLLVVTLGASRAVAEQIAIESFVGQRSPDAERVMPLVRAVFDRHGFTVQPAVLTRLFRAHAFRPGLVASKFARELPGKTEDGVNAFVNEKFDDAARILGELIAGIRRSPLVIARDPKNHALAFQVLLFYALASGRQAEIALVANHREEAAQAVRRRDDAMTELIRSFPSKIVTGKEYGHEAEVLYKRNRGELDATGRGRLTVTVSDPDAVIYINEIVQGTAKIAVGDFVPGSYRVLVQLPTEESREYELEVIANQEARLDIDWGVDSMFGVGAWVGFRYPTEKDHAREAQLVRRIARQHTNATVAVTLTVTRSHGRPAVVATAYDVATGRLVHSSMVELASNHDEEAIDHLVDCITGTEGAMTECLAVEHPEYTPPPPEPKLDDTPPALATSDHPSSRAAPGATSLISSTPGHVQPRSGAGSSAGSYVLPAIGIGAGITSIVIGKYLERNVKPDPDPRAPQPKYLYSYPGIAMVLGGGLVTIGACYWLFHTWRSSRHAPSASPSIAITPRSAVVGWSTGF